MLLSLEELIVWTGLGPFEVALHSLGLLVFVCLATLQLEGVFSASWHAVFSPLYVALGLHLYYLTIVSVRMAVWGFQPPRPAKKALICLAGISFVGVGVLLYAEYSFAAYLNGAETPDNLISSLSIVLVYLITRLCFVYRTLRPAAPEDY